MKTKIHNLLPFVAFAAFAASAPAASFLVGFQQTIGSEQATGATSEGGPYHVSVNPNNPGYAAKFWRMPNTNTDGIPYQRPFTDPVQAWSWVGGPTNNVLTQNNQTDGSGRITYTTNSTTFDGFGQNQLQLWTTSDPGPDLINPATLRDSAGPGYRGGFVDATATINISGLTSGTVYVFYGDFRGRPSVSAVMRDSSGIAPDITIAEAHLNNDIANRGEYYVAELDFVTDGIYDEIAYTWLAGGDSGTNGRFGGTVLTAVPEPSTGLLGAIGCLFLLRRCRK